MGLVPKSELLRAHGFERGPPRGSLVLEIRTIPAPALTALRRPSWRVTGVGTGVGTAEAAAQSFFNVFNMKMFSISKKQGAAGITTAAPRIAGQWGRGDNRLPE